MAQIALLECYYLLIANDKAPRRDKAIPATFNLVKGSPPNIC